MSALTEKEIAVKIRRRMNAPVSDRLRYHPLIEDGLLLLARDVAMDPRRRHLVMTPKDSTTATLDGQGKVDLSDLMDDPRILLDRLEFGSIYHPSSRDPLVRREINGRKGNYDNMYLHYELEGTVLSTIGHSSTALAGDLSFAVAYWPTLAQLPEQLVEGLVEKCTELLIEKARDYEEEANDE